MKYWKYKIAAVLSILLGAWLVGRCGNLTRLHQPTPPSILLPSNDKEQIVVDPATHRITIRRPGGDVVRTLPDKKSTIDIRKDGSIQVTSAQMGFELRPFFGPSMSDKFRLASGADLFFFKRLDIGTGLGITPKLESPAVFVKLTYNVWSNMQAGLTFDSKSHIGAIVSVRL